ncbi:NUDIX domain-containing protein [Candidatus Uhrbacteria bacterium]|nr:NUDIX domain-containing protein [Candidatus Uhrbacteria bacterium]
MFRFCPQCRKPITLKGSKLFECPCGFHFYINPAPCALALLTNNRNQLLFVVRGRDPRKGYLDLPGGFLEQGESAEQGIVRELKEELGVALKKIRYIASYPDRYLYNSINYHVISSAFFGELSDSEARKMKAADDVSAIEWHSVKKVPVGRFAFPSMKKIVYDFRKDRPVSRWDKGSS